MVANNISLLFPQLLKINSWLSGIGQNYHLLILNGLNYMEILPTAIAKNHIWGLLIKSHFIHYTFVWSVDDILVNDLLPFQIFRPTNLKSTKLLFHISNVEPFYFGCQWIYCYFNKCEISHLSINSMRISCSNFA